ncbi:MAG: outer membrane beta-barrel protein [Bacteroidia bacterium]
MREEYLESIIRQKLAELEVPVSPSHWEELLERLHLAFDALIREKLESLQIQAIEADWEAMQQQLDHAFDQAIQAQLSAISLNQEAGDWGQMNAQIEDMPLEALMAGKLAQAELAFMPDDWNAFEAALDDNPLDTQIREGLAQLDSQALNPEWDRMLSALDQDFDHLVKTALKGHQIPFQTAHWSMMAASLDESTLDTAFRERLVPYQIAYVASDWPMMADRLEEPFDEVVRQKLGSLEYPPINKDWRKLVALLDAQIIPTEQAIVWYANWRNYSAAAAAVLLFLFTLLGGSDSWRLRTDETLAVDTHSGFILPDIHSNALQDAALTNALNPDQDAQSSQNAIAAVTESSEDSLGQSVNDESLLSFASLTPLDRANNLASTLGQKPTDFSTSFIYSALANDKIPHENDPGAMEAYLQQIDYSEIRRVGPVSFGEGNLDDAFSKQAPQSDYETQTWKPDFRVGLYGSNARTFAELTGDQSLSGYAYGIRVEMVLNDHLSVISGVNYSEKRFRHTYPYFDAERGFFENVLEGQLYLLEAPLLLRYQLGMDERTQTRFYVQAGIIAQVSSQENYWHYNADNPVNLSLERSQQYKTLSPEKLERGFNTYAGNIHAAIGLDYPIMDRLSIQLEPYLLMGLQPTKGAGTAGLNKRLTTVGLGVGLQYNLAKLKRP